MNQDQELSPFSVNDIVQIVDPEHPWFPCLLIVTEVKSWGVQCYTILPPDGGMAGTAMAYLRLRNDEVASVGKAAIIRKQTEAEE